MLKKTFVLRVSFKDKDMEENSKSFCVRCLSNMIQSSVSLLAYLASSRSETVFPIVRFKHVRNKFYFRLTEEISSTYESKIGSI